jgi:hypothetical protein
MGTDLVQISHELSRSRLVPAAFRGKPEDILLIAMTGQELGFGATASLRLIHVIEGKPSLSAEGMLALVRRDGHSVSGASNDTEARVAGRRGDNGDEMEVTFTLDDAKRANLTGKDTWKKYPKSMLWSRAVSQLCRMLFPDVLLGVSYVPDELGVDAIDIEPVEQATDEQIMEIEAVLSDLDEDAKADLKAWWKNERLPRLELLDTHQADQVIARLRTTPDPLPADPETGDIFEAAEVVA